MILDDATKRQATAADPKVSTWLTANAGSGKTRVLTDRVARLLLDKVSPQNILCLTYTKAAASEMQIRLFETLGQWAMMADDKLAEKLKKLGANDIQDHNTLAFARTLFARAIDTPGGLRIQTIHSYCSSLLRRFPLEAGVSPLFREMDERAVRSLHQEVVEAMATGVHAKLVRDLAEHNSGEDFANLTAETSRHRETACNSKSDAEIWRLFELNEGADEDLILANTFMGDEAELFAALQTILSQSDKSTDQKAAKKLAQVNFLDPNISDLTRLTPLLLFGAKVTKNQPFGAKIGTFPTKGIREANQNLIARLDEIMSRVELGRIHYARLLAAKKTKAFLRFSSVFLKEYDSRKSMRGWLDFDDLISKTRNLLSDPSVAQWVLFRLDGGLDHILVDEAQDTSPGQWRVIELLAQEFSAGIGARPDVLRTIFVVGDLKQSIYSFQGADPRAFEQMRRHFSQALSASKKRLQDQALEHSFRSSQVILSLVDAVCQATNLSSGSRPASHLAFYPNMPGRVQLWPVVEKADAQPDREWFDPTDKIATNDHRVVLAEDIAAHIKQLVDTGSIPDKGGNVRRVEYGDFLILVQRRSELFHQIIRACKTLDLPIAGADRLKIGAEMAVKDLQALLAFLALPQDSLSLAAALRSPLFGISEAALFDLANGRGDTDLWASLVRMQRNFQAPFEILTDLRNQVDFLLPYELLERILTRHGGRNKLLARLGPEADDGIDALLNQAVAYEATNTPSLTGFLQWLDADGLEIKRQSDNAGGRIRVMTTHGAKGLESPIVILPDTGDRRPPQKDEIVKTHDGSLMWKTPADWRPAMMVTAIDRAKQSHDEESARLLYVALTRAEKWLIVCASGEVKKPGDSWYRRVEEGMTAAGATQSDTPAGQGLCMEHGDWPESGEPRIPDAPLTGIQMPLWSQTKAASPGAGEATINPSNMPGEKSLAGETVVQDAKDTAARGTNIHLLLHHLPDHSQSDWPQITEQLLPSLNKQEAIELLSEVAAVIANPQLAHIFADDVLVEVGITAPTPGQDRQRIRGTIDRLVISPSQVLVVDFKSNRVIPGNTADTPIGILRQMAAYLTAVQPIYPDHEINLAIVWTHSATLMPLPHDIVRAAWHSSPHLDLPQRRP